MRLLHCLRGFLRDLAEPPEPAPPSNAPVVDPQRAAPDAKVAAHLSAARNALLQGNLDEAAEAATVALRLAPGDLFAAWCLGRARLRQGRYEEARAAFGAAHAADRFGLCQGWLDEVDRSEAAARPAPAGPWPEAAGDAVEAERSARAALRAGRLEEALALAEEAVAADPKNLMACHLLGCVLWAQGREAQALAVFERARRHDLVGLADGWIAAAREGRLLGGTPAVE